MFEQLYLFLYPDIVVSKLQAFEKKIVWKINRAMFCALARDIENTGATEIGTINNAHSANSQNR